MTEKIGFIGQGWIGKNYSDDLEDRGYSVVRYALEDQYVNNKADIKNCKIVFIAVPTPTTYDGFSYEYVIDALTCLSSGSTAVIKSTVVPGTTKKLQKMFPDLTVMHSPEFLAEKTVKFDVKNPARNIVGITQDNHECISRAEAVMKILPKASYQKIMSADNAELVKYAGNTFLTTKVLFMNILYDFVNNNSGDWSTVQEALVADKRIGVSHTQPVFEGGRGAGGHCFIKDFEALRQMHGSTVGKNKSQAVLNALTELNIELLTKSNKSLDLLTDIFELKIKE